MASTKIEWADRVWNPVTGCSKVSEGCRNCYAERIAKRFWGKRPFSQVQLHEDRLDEPLHWRKPSRIFVNSMSDLFHPDIHPRFMLAIIDVMSKASQHTFIILTKRPELAWDIFLPNVWLGVSVEDQKTADERIPLLLRTSAAVRFVSVEPMLGPIDISYPLNGCPEIRVTGHDDDGEWIQTAPPLDWVICGGESGPNARPMHPYWVRSLRDQCQAAGVPFFFKQWGEYYPIGNYDSNGVLSEFAGMSKVGKKAAGSLLDGQEWNEFPEVK